MQPEINLQREKLNGKDYLQRGNFYRALANVVRRNYLMPFQNTIAKQKAFEHG